MLLSRAIALNNHAARTSRQESVVYLRLALTTLRDRCELGLCKGEESEFGVSEIPSELTALPINPTISCTNSIGSNLQMTPFAGMEKEVSSTPDHHDLASSPKIIRTTRSGSKASVSGHGRRGDSYLEVFDDLLVVSVENEVSKDLVAAVVLLNLAVLRQTTGIRLNRSSMLVQARNVYHMAMAVLESFSDGGGEIPSLLLLVLFNNLAAIEAHSHGYNAMRYYLECGRELLSESDHGLSDADLERFFRNVMLPIPSVAAAA